MNTDKRRCIDGLTERVRGVVFEVFNHLGAGFLEKPKVEWKRLRITGRVFPN